MEYLSGDRNKELPDGSDVENKEKAKLKKQRDLAQNASKHQIEVKLHDINVVKIDDIPDYQLLIMSN